MLKDIIFSRFEVEICRNKNHQKLHLIFCNLYNDIYDDCAEDCKPPTAGNDIVELLHTFHDQSQNLIMPAIPYGSFDMTLYSMYLRCLPKEKVAFDLKMNCDERGSFTELLKTIDHGQFLVNISKPGITNGQHWHNTKREFFIVVSGHGLIQKAKDQDGRSDRV